MYLIKYKIPISPLTLPYMHGGGCKALHINVFSHKLRAFSSSSNFIAIISSLALNLTLILARPVPPFFPSNPFLNPFRWKTRKLIPTNILLDLVCYIYMFRLPFTLSLNLRPDSSSLVCYLGNPPFPRLKL